MRETRTHRPPGGSNSPDVRIQEAVQMSNPPGFQQLKVVALEVDDLAPATEGGQPTRLQPCATCNPPRGC